MPPSRKSAVTSGPELAASLEDALFQIKRVVVGQERLVERAMLALLTGGHCLIEGVPGLAKTLTVSTLARVVGLKASGDTGAIISSPLPERAMIFPSATVMPPEPNSGCAQTCSPVSISTHLSCALAVVSPSTP